MLQEGIPPVIRPHREIPPKKDEKNTLPEGDPRLFTIGEEMANILPHDVETLTDDLEGRLAAEREFSDLPESEIDSGIRVAFMDVDDNHDNLSQPPASGNETKQDLEKEKIEAEVDAAFDDLQRLTNDPTEEEPQSLAA